MQIAHTHGLICVPSQLTAYSQLDLWTLTGQVCIISNVSRVGGNAVAFMTGLMSVTCIGYDHDIALQEYSQGCTTRPRAFPCSPSPHALHLMSPLQVLLLPAHNMRQPTHQHIILPKFVWLLRHKQLVQSASLGAVVISSSQLCIVRTVCHKR